MATTGSPRSPPISHLASCTTIDTIFVICPLVSEPFGAKRAALIFFSSKLAQLIFNYLADTGRHRSCNRMTVLKVADVKELYCSRIRRKRVTVYIPGRTAAEFVNPMDFLRTVRASVSPDELYYANSGAFVHPPPPAAPQSPSPNPTPQRPILRPPLWSKYLLRNRNYLIHCRGAYATYPMPTHYIPDTVRHCRCSSARTPTVMVRHGVKFNFFLSLCI